MSERERAKAHLDDFVRRAAEEFGDPAELDALTEEARALTGADRVGVRSDAAVVSMAREGYLCRVHIGRTRFAAKLAPEDLGIDPKAPGAGDFIRRYVSLGEKFLLPNETLKELDRIEKQMRRAVNEEFGIPTLLGSFVPYKNIPLLKERLEELKAGYFGIRDEILRRYDDHKRAAAEAYRGFAFEAYRRKKADPWYVPTEGEISEFVGRAMSRFPEREHVGASFYVEVVWDVIAFTAKLAEHEARLRLVEERKRLYEEELALIEGRLAEASRVQAERERQAILLERERARTKVLQEEAKRRAIVEAIAQARDRYLPQMEQVFADLAGAVHGIVYDAVTRAAETMDTHGALQPWDSRNLRKLVETVRTLAVAPDPEVEAWMDRIQSILDTPSKKRDPASCREALDRIRAEAGRAILSLGRAPRTLRGRDLQEVEAAVEEVGLRQARAQVNIGNVPGAGHDAVPARQPRCSGAADAV